MRNGTAEASQQSSTVEESQQKAARAAGLAFLISFVLLAYGEFGIRRSLLSGRASAFSRYGAYVRIVADDPAVPDQCRSSVHRCAAAWFEPAES